MLHTSSKTARIRAAKDIYGTEIGIGRLMERAMT